MEKNCVRLGKMIDQTKCPWFNSKECRDFKKNLLNVYNKHCLKNKSNLN